LTDLYFRVNKKTLLGKVLPIGACIFQNKNEDTNSIIKSIMILPQKESQAGMFTKQKKVDNIYKFYVQFLSKLSLTEFWFFEVQLIVQTVKTQIGFKYRYVELRYYRKLKSRREKLE